MANLEFCDTHNMVTYLNKSEGSEGFHQIVDFLNHCHIRLDSGEIQITATIYRKVKIITEASIRRHLKLEDYDGISTLPTTEIFEQLALMGNMRRASKGYTGVDIPLFPTMVVQGEGSTVPVESHYTPTGATSTSQPPLSSPSRIPTRQEFEVPQPESPTQTHAADEAASTGVDVRYGGAATTVSSLDAGQGSGNIDKTPTMPHDSPLPRVHKLGSDEGRMQHNKLMDLVTKLSDRVVALETDLRQTKKVYGAAYTKLIKKVKKLERATKSSQYRRIVNIVVSDDEDDAEDSSKQGRKIDEIDQDLDITLVQHDAEIQGRHRQEIEFETEVYTAEDVSTAGAAVTIAGASISTASTPRVSTVKDISTDETLVYIRRSATKDKEEREKYSEAEKGRLLAKLINQRKKYFAAKRAEERRNKPLTQAQQRTYMSNYIKHMGSHTLQQLKRLSFDELKNLFEATMRRVGTFVRMETEIKREVPELATGSSKRDAEKELDQGSSKRQKTGENSKPAEESKEKEDDELSQE
ncbi:hypothetical protein Tco_0978213 [Tanacetum coccineum]|uniref:Uncharacterized protein n=1 Tax=Tanacetum coccineum TaxID=301880 RepID=A0ABQ5EM83_9ASTR